MTKRELEAEVERLRAELVAVRAQQAAHVCISPSCTCLGTALPSRCPVHSWQGNGWVSPPNWGWQNNVCAGAAGYNPVLTFPWNNGAAQPYISIDMAPAGCAAGAAPQLQTFMVNC